MRRFLLSLMSLTFLTTAVVRGVLPRAAAVSTSATSAILVDAESGRVLYEQNAREQRLIASITKLMTALVAVESMPDLETVVTVPHEATLAEGSSMYLRTGEEISLRALLYGLLLSSGNDAAIAIAVACAGDVPTFADWMNRRAESLGMQNSHFVNPNGLNDENHFSTAYDMSLLAIACMEHETIAEIVSTRSITIGERSLSNHNKLLWQYDGCVGMKTGYTERAGRTLVSAAERDGQRLIVVTLNDPNDWADHAALFDYGFSGYPRTVLSEEGQEYVRLPVTGSLVPFVPVRIEETIAWPLSDGEAPRVEVELPDTLAAPVARGAVVGQLTWYLGDTVLGQSYLRARVAVHRNTYEAEGIIGRLLALFRGEKAEPDVPETFRPTMWVLKRGA